MANNRKQKIPWEVQDACGNITSDKMEVLQRWEKDFSSIYRNKSTQDFEFDDAFLQQISDEQLPHQVEDSPASTLNESITLEEVQKAVYKAKLRKARGVDDIPAEVLKNSHCINMLHKIISVAFENTNCRTL